MAKKTYVPTLIKMLHMLCQYITRYRAVIAAGLTALEVTNADAKLAAVIAACEAITLVTEIPEGS